MDIALHFKITKYKKSGEKESTQPSVKLSDVWIENFIRHIFFQRSLFFIDVKMKINLRNN